MSAPIRWLVIGAGRAGAIRARDIAAEPGHTLREHLPGRTAAAALQAAIEVDDIDAVAICVENARHGDLAAAALQAGKHALVEFPLCHTALGAQALLARARAAGLVLHLEVIGLLSAGHAELKNRAETTGIKALRVDFRGGLYRWVADEVHAARWGQLAVARLHALWDIAGPLHLDAVELQEREDGGYRLEVHLTGANSEQIELIEQRGPKLGRGVSWMGLDRRGLPVERLRPEPGGLPLFLMDLRRCGDRIRGVDSAAYVDDAALLGVVSLAERISTLAVRRHGLFGARSR